MARQAESAFGTASPEVRAIDVQGKPFLLAKIVPLDDAPTFSDDALKQFGGGFVIDAWLANWEAGGAWQLTADRAGKPLRTATNGGGLFRQSGEPKGSAFTDDVPELRSMRDPLRSTSFGYRKVTARDVKAQLQRFASWYPAHRAEIDDAIDRTSLGRPAAATLKAKLAARAAWLTRQAKK